MAGRHGRRARLDGRRPRSHLLAGAAVLVLVILGISALLDDGEVGLDHAAPPDEAAGDEEGTASQIDPFAAAVSAPDAPPGVRPPPPEPVTLAFTGDIHGEGGVRDALRRGQNPFAGMASALADADVTVANLETAAANTGAPVDKSFTFNAPVEILDQLAASGVDVISLANNHSLDWGFDALQETIDRARGAGLAPIGAGADRDTAMAPHVADVRGVRVAIVAASRVLPDASWFATATGPGVANAYDLEDTVEAVRAASAMADHTIVVIHWGDELAPCPNEVQLELADAFADAGASLVVGHHPHILQGIETRDDAVVAYSLGNFAFYARDVDTRRTGVLRVTLAGTDVRHELLPGRIDDALPVAVDGEAAQDVLDVVAARSPGGSAGCTFR